MRTAEEWGEVLHQRQSQPYSLSRIRVTAATIREIQKEAAIYGAMMGIRGEVLELRAKLDIAQAHVATLYPLAEVLSGRDCTRAAVLGGDDCGKCGPCLAKPIEREVAIQNTCAGWSDWRIRALDAEAALARIGERQ